MKDLVKKMRQGDVAEACRRAGVTSQVYYNSLKKSKMDWTAGEIRVNIELRKIIEERDSFLNN